MGYGRVLVCEWNLGIYIIHNMNKITEGMTGQQAADVIYNNDVSTPVVNVDELFPLTTGRYTLATATAAVHTDYRGIRKTIRFSPSAGVVEEWQFKADDVAGWATVSNWAAAGGSANVADIESDIAEIQEQLNDTTKTTTEDVVVSPNVFGSTAAHIEAYYWNQSFEGVSAIKEIKFKSATGFVRVAIINVSTKTVDNLLYTITNTAGESGTMKTIAIAEPISLTSDQVIALAVDFYYGPSTGDVMRQTGGSDTGNYAVAYQLTGQGNVVTTTTKGLVTKVSELEDKVDLIESVVLEKEYVQLNSDTFTALDSDKWTYAGTWSPGNGGVTTSGIGSATYMQCKRVYHADNRFMRTKIIMHSNSHLKIPISFGGINSGEGASCFAIDFVAKELAIHSVGNGLDTQYTSTGYNSTYLESVDIPTEMVGDREYIVEIYKKGTTSTISLLDTLTGGHLSVSHTGWGAGRQNQNYAFYTEVGTPPVFLKFEVYALNNPDAVFAGDSITEGVYVYDRSKRYAELFRSENPTKKVMISARGGDDIHGIAAKFASEYNIYKPKYLCVLIGANGGNTLPNLQALKASCDAIGTTLVLNYRTCQQASNAHISGNVMIAAVGVNGARFDKATAVNNNPGDTSTAVDGSDIRYNPSLYEDGGLHPNALGDQAMFNRLRIDTPELYF